MKRDRKLVTRAVALVPMALLSVGWTCSLVSSPQPEGVRTSLPPDLPATDHAIKRPASYSTPGSIGRGVPARAAARVTAAASTNGIPDAAIAAYQRAERVINAADKACNLPWQVVAAIGRVESDHGRYGGSTLGTDGIARPGIYGIPLNGRHDTAVIRDTDAGQWDRDEVYDRAVGPMQIIPSTWMTVGVDADGDSRRNPQDMDDAALAGAVYLCSGPEDLATDPGLRAAVLRYNHSQSYVNLVLSLMRAYQEGDYVAVPNYVTSAVVFTPYDGYRAPGSGTKSAAHHAGTAATGSTSGQSTAAPTPTPTPAPDPSPAPQPVDDDPVKAITKTIEDTRDTVTQTVNQVLSLPLAIASCTTQGYNALLTPQQWNACLDRLM
jgi:Transglycosylase SLT domain